MKRRPYPEPVQRTLAIAAAKGIPCEVVPHEQSGKTTEEAARALGVDVAAIIKTLVLDTDQGFAVAIIAGNEHLDFKVVARHLRCRKVRLAKPEFAEAILEDLEWLGLEWEKPVRHQSKNIKDYRAALDRLRRKGLVYPRFCAFSWSMLRHVPG